MNILVLYVLKISGNVRENQVKVPYTPPPPKAERFDRYVPDEFFYAHVWLFNYTHQDKGSHATNYVCTIDNRPLN